MEWTHQNNCHYSMETCSFVVNNFKIKELHFAQRFLFSSNCFFYLGRDLRKVKPLHMHTESWVKSDNRHSILNNSRISMDYSSLFSYLNIYYFISSLFFSITNHFLLFGVYISPFCPLRALNTSNKYSNSYFVSLL